MADPPVFSVHRVRKVNTTDLGLTLQSLRPRTEYEVRVQSFNSQGPSEQEAVTQIKTETEGNLLTILQ